MQVSRRTPTATGRSRSPTPPSSTRLLPRRGKRDEGVQLRVSGITAPSSSSPRHRFRDRPDHQIHPHPLGLRSRVCPGVSEAGQEGGHPGADPHRGGYGMGRGGRCRRRPAASSARSPASPNLSMEGIFTIRRERDPLLLHRPASGTPSWRSWRNWRRRACDPGPPHRQQRRDPELPQYHLDMVRPGIMSYGIYPPRKPGRRRPSPP